ncbi:hypothetical protein DIPPA_59859 [Diplonema papillatum]|nr:hypothetical protein DIPPA_59859 [Diplonema papillatum]
MSAVRVCVFLALCASGFGAVGGIGRSMPCVDECRGIALGLRQSLEAKTETVFQVFHPVEYKTQVVAGVNYFIKIEVDDQCLYVRAFKPLPERPPATSMSAIAFIQKPAELVKVMKSDCASPITYFA